MPGDLISRYHVLGVSVYKFTGTQSEGPHNFTIKLMGEQYWSLGKYGNTIFLYIYVININSIFVSNIVIFFKVSWSYTICRFYGSENSNKSRFLNADCMDGLVQDCSLALSHWYMVYKTALQTSTCLTGRMTFPGPPCRRICWTLPLCLYSQVVNGCPRWAISV